jgi:hypothetical protein
VIEVKKLDGESYWITQSLRENCSQLWWERCHYKRLREQLSLKTERGSKLQNAGGLQRLEKTLPRTSKQECDPTDTLILTQ